MCADQTIGRVFRPWVSIVLGCGGVALVAQAIVKGEAINESVAAAIVLGTSVSLAIWAYNAGRAVVLIKSADGVLIKWRGVVRGPISSIILTERFNVSPWHYRVSVTCKDGSAVAGVLFPPASMIYSKDEFRRRLRSFLHPLVAGGDDL